MARHSVHGFWNIVQHQVEVELIGFVSGRVEAVLERDDIRMGQQAHDLQLAVLVETKAKAIAIAAAVAISLRAQHALGWGGVVGG